ncbi:hypothetical protein KL938_001044 [Ogataea parapolymorpha]|nr:hypothetical protein KL938_001044 [Ogataea parapolymorpha]
MSALNAWFLKIRNLVDDRYRSKELAYCYILIGTCLDNLNITAAFSMTESLQKQMGATTADATWVVSSYALTMRAFIILFGKLSDIHGLHEVFTTGLFAMSIMSLICAVITKTIIPLIVFRAFQGIAGASMIPSAVGLCGNYFHGPQLSTAINYLMLAFCASLGIGTILRGAFSITSIGYRAFFYFSFAISFVSSIALFFLIVPVERTREHNMLRSKYLDYGGALLLVGGLILIIYGFTEAGTRWDSPKVYATIPVGTVVVLIVLLFENFYVIPYQRTHRNSNSYRSKLVLLFPFEVVKITNFLPFFVGLTFNYAGFTALITSLLLYHEFVDGDSAIVAAVKVFCTSAGILIGAPLYRPWMQKLFGSKSLLIWSAVVCLGTSIWITRIDHANRYSFWIYEFVPQLLYGYGTNIFYQVYYLALLSETPLHLQGNVTGIFQTIGQIGKCWGTAIASSIIGALDSSKVYSKSYVQTRCVNALWFTVACFALELVMMLFSKNSRPTQKSKTDETKDESEKTIEEYDIENPA